MLSDEKNRPYIDLHLHSFYSDGTFSLKEIVEYASTKKLAAVSLTDHDCIAGVQEITGLSERIGLEVVPGVEISSMYENTDVHMLGYFFDLNNANLNTKLEEIRQIRLERARKIVERLNRRNIGLRFERVLEFSKGFSIGRPHIAAALLAEEYAASYSEAFDKFVGNNTEFYIPVQKLTPRDAIQLIKEAGGLAILAHPVVLGRDDLIERFIKDGLDGLEVYSPRLPLKTFRAYRQICHKYNLLETGGSDCHGPYLEDILIGSVPVPYALLEKMKKRKNGVSAASGAQ
jgi:3',5'-nucleoside bisphosphate phosphatase